MIKVARQVNQLQVALFHQLNIVFGQMNLHTPAQRAGVIKQAQVLNPDGSAKMQTQMTPDEIRRVLKECGVDPREEEAAS